MSQYLMKRRAIMLGLQAPDPKKEPKPIAKESEKMKAKKDAEKKAHLPAGAGTPWKQLPKRSEKMKGIMAAIKPLYKSFLKEKPLCEINSPICTAQSTCVHHTAGRGMNHLMDTNTWEASCDACNHYVEEHDDWAKENGHKISRHKKSI